MEFLENVLDEMEYNPSDSEKLAQWSPSDLSGGYMHETETLYKTGKGNYFIHHQGGLFSRYRSSDTGKAWYGGTSIRPISEEEAYAWCLETGNYELIDSHFFLLKIIS